MNKKIIFGIIGGIIIVIFAIFISVKFLRLPVKTNPTASSSTSTSTTHSSCLADNEYADYPINYFYPAWEKAAKVPVIISVRDQNTKDAKFSFTINNVPPDAYEQLEIHRCGVYVLREFRNGSNWDRELWKYDYSGNGKKLLTLLETKNNQIVESGPQYNADFYVDSSEKYLALDYGTYPDTITEIKNLLSPSLTDILTITSQNIVKADPQLSQANAMAPEPGGWSSDGKYLWGAVSAINMDNVSYFRINIETKKINIFSMPLDAIHLDKPNFDTGYVFYVYGPPFTGIAEETKLVDAEWQKEGRTTSLFLYNLFTKSKTLISTSPKDPGWNFSEHWISDNQFQYLPPSGVTTTYTITQQ